MSAEPGGGGPQPHTHIRLYADLLILLVALASTVAYVVGAGGEGFPLDDGWIHQVYARNLAERGEWAFVSGVPSAGSTSPLWTVLLAAGYGLGVPYRLWALALGALCLGATGALGARVAERLFPRVRFVGVLTGLCITLEWHLVWAAASGMETALFSALSVAVVLLALHALEPTSPPPSVWRGAALGLVGAALTLTRPEGVLLVGLAALAALASARGWRVWLTWAVGAAMGWLAGVTPAALLNLSAGGSVLPNTSAAKQAEYAALLALPYLRRLQEVVAPLTAGVVAPLLPGLLWWAGLWTRRVRVERETAGRLLPSAWALALLMLYAARLPVSYQHGRYVIPALPHLIVTGVGGMLLLLEVGRRSMWGRVLSRSLFLVALGILAIFWGVGWRVYATDVSIIQSEMVAAARHLADEIPPADLLAVHDIGAVGYFAPRPILDLAGLVSPEVIPIIRDEAALLALMEARGAAYLMTFPDWYPHIVSDPRVQRIFQTDGTAPFAGGENMAIYRLVWEHE